MSLSVSFPCRMSALPRFTFSTADNTQAHPHKGIISLSPPISIWRREEARSWRVRTPRESCGAGNVDSVHAARSRRRARRRRGMLPASMRVPFPAVAGIVKVSEADGFANSEVNTDEA